MNNDNYHFFDGGIYYIDKLSLVTQDHNKTKNNQKSKDLVVKILEHTHLEVSKRKFLFDKYQHYFKKLGLRQNEVKSLTRMQRTEIADILSIDPLVLKKDALALADNINEIKKTNITLFSEGYGSFLLLTCLIMDFLNDEKKYNFHLSNVPLKLFPKSITRSANKNVLETVNITFDVTANCWPALYPRLMEGEVGTIFQGITGFPEQKNLQKFA